MPDSSTTELRSASAGRSGWLVEQLRGSYDSVLGIVAPPRCGSTMVARSLWQHPQMRWYAHEPFDRWFHETRALSTVQHAIECSLDRTKLPAASNTACTADGLLIKEMSFQLADQASALIGAVDRPLILVVRDPDAAIASRARQRSRGGQRPSFPVAETGWEQLARLIERLREDDVSHLVVDAATLSAAPERGVAALCEALALPQAPEMLTWPALPGTDLGGLGGTQDHWYERVLNSTGFELMSNDAATTDRDLLDPALRDHLSRAQEVYQDLLADPRRAV